MSNPVLSHADPMPLAATRSHRATCNTLIRGALELNLMPFDGVVLFLAALTVGLFNRVLGADDAPFRPVMGKRGEAGAAAGTATTDAGSSSREPTTEAASASETPSRWAKAVRERAGASPRVRSAASSTGKST